MWKMGVGICNFNFIWHFSYIESNRPYKVRADWLNQLHSRLLSGKTAWSTTSDLKPYLSQFGSSHHHRAGNNLNAWEHLTSIRRNSKMKSGQIDPQVAASCGWLWAQPPRMTWKNRTPVRHQLCSIIGLAYATAGNPFANRVARNANCVFSVICDSLSCGRSFSLVTNRSPSHYPVSHPVTQPLIQPLTQSVTQPLPTHSPSQSPSHSPSQSPSQSSSHSSSRSPSQSPRHSSSHYPVSHPTTHPVSHLVSLPATHPATHPASHPVSHPATHPASRSVDSGGQSVRPPSQSVGHLVTQPVRYPATTQPVTQLVGQSVTQSPS